MDSLNIKTIHSLETFYGTQRLQTLSSSWIDKYLSWLPDDKLCNLFEDVFLESPSLFDIEGRAKETINDLMMNFYHNEAFVKSSFIKSIIRNKSVSFFELPINDSRIDLCSINGHSVAYEIKTKYDTTKRLKKQLNDYSKAFEYVYVICSDDKTNDILKILPSYAGVYEYDDSKKKPSFILIKEATISPYIDSATQISVLRKSEIPNNINELKKDEINEVFKNKLKERYKKKWKMLCDNYKDIYELDYQYYFKNA